jgi:hypothetical protein
MTSGKAESVPSWKTLIITESFFLMFVGEAPNRGNFRANRDIFVSPGLPLIYNPAETVPSGACIKQ